MKSFLEELAEDLLAKYPSLEGLTIVFPNRRAVLYFHKHLGNLLTKPVFSPNLLTIEEFVSKLSPLYVPDRLELIHRLYEVYSGVMNSRADGEEPLREPFDQFYFWGDMLLRDFDEVDKYRVNAGQLFRDLSNQKELDTGFDFLSDEQKKYLLEFWGNFSGALNDNKRKFLRVWRLLPRVFEEFRQQLIADGMGYDGLVQRSVSETLAGISQPAWKGKLVFAGFNALTSVEEQIISHFVSREGAAVHWDLDAYYVNNEAQEAGRFFREYQSRPALKATFPADVPSNFSKPKSVRIMGSAQHVGQAKLMSTILKEQLDKGMDPQDTLIVLPDEKQLLPVLHSVAGHVEELNVSMGFPLAGTPVFNLIEFLVELHQQARGGYFNHRQVLSILSHPYVVAANPSHAYHTRKSILDQNQVSIAATALAKEPLCAILFQELGETNILEYLRGVLMEIGALEPITPLDKEYVFHALTLVNRLGEIMGVQKVLPQNQKESLKSFSRLFRQLGRTQKIPFTGEPLKGLQIMGVLETRNLDFKNVFVLSLNEGSLPASGGKASYIPYNIRKAYAMPTAEHQDAMYAYLFYRVLQRAENIHLFYNTEPDILGQGEWSRFLQQLILESGWKVNPEILHTPIRPRTVNPIVIEKNNRVLEALAKLNEGTARSKGISPTALNAYIDCSLRFYFRYVARLKEPKEMEDDLDARQFGNLLHKVLERFYKGVQEKKKTSLIQSDDFKNAKAAVAKLIEETFREEFRFEGPVKYEGQMLVVREVIRTFAERVLEHDQAYTPFTIEGLERGEMLYYVPLRHAPGQAVLSGKIDRIDSKDGSVRILDYKTGKTDPDFKGVDELFKAKNDRPSAVFQTLIYTLIYKSNNPTSRAKLAPGLVSRRNLFEDEFRPHLLLDKQEVEDANEFLTAFEGKLKELLEDIFDPAKPFVQTEVTELCRNCPYKAICYR